jgi:hypothetical protein
MMPYRGTEIIVKRAETLITDIENHFHNSDQVFGLTSDALARKAVTPVVVTGGSGAYGTELFLTGGTVIESGDTSKEFDLVELTISAIGTSARTTALEFYYGPIGTPVACTFDDVGGAANNIVISAAHGLTVGDKIRFTAGAGALPAGVLDHLVYYVRAIAAGYFTLALGSATGAEVDLADDGGACFWVPVNTATGSQTNTQTLLTECIVSGASTDTAPQRIRLRSPKVSCDNTLSVRGWSSGGTNVISFYLTLHTYTKS